MKNDNMTLWNQVCDSDPASLKAVSFGSRSFTAIDPMYQIRKATEVFGPIGKGWGWDATTREAYFADGSAVFISEVSVWIESREKAFGPFTGCRKFFDSKKGRIAEDAPKMATTDALTKALSHIGFNADVFLGKMDGNKYADKNSTAPLSGEAW